MIAAAESLHLPFADASADAAVTSPPYWGALRAYEGPQVRSWPAISYPPMPGLPPVEIPAQDVALGHEPDPYAYVGHLLQVFREVRRVLRPAAALAVNLGDSYAGGGSYSGQDSNASSTLGKRPGRDRHLATNAAFCGGGHGVRQAGLPSKNLLLMPWRFALAMQADGWILRSRMPGGAEVLPGDDVGIEPDIVWRKVATMPESVRDRPTVDFEDVLIFSQAPRYFWDQEAGREKAVKGTAGSRMDKGRSRRRRVQEGTRKNDSKHTGRNMRSVWTINPEPTSEEHFAAFPVALAARLIRVLTSERGVCPECGAPWVRETTHVKGITGRASSRKSYLQTGGRSSGSLGQNKGSWGKTVTTGWRLPCGHRDEEILAHVHDPTRYAVPATVLDPFAGLARTWEACRETGRRFIGTDLGIGYCRLALSRNDLRAMQRRRISERGTTVSGPLFEARETPCVSSP